MTEVRDLLQKAVALGVLQRMAGNYRVKGSQMEDVWVTEDQIVKVLEEDRSLANTLRNCVHSVDMGNPYAMDLLWPR